MYDSDDAAMMSHRTYNAAERYPWAGAILATLTLLAMGLVLTFLLGGILQWRTDVRSQSNAAASQRLTWDMHDPSISRSTQISALR